MNSTFLAFNDTLENEKELRGLSREGDEGKYDFCLFVAAFGQLSVLESEVREQSEMSYGLKMVFENHTLFLSLLSSFRSFSFLSSRSVIRNMFYRFSFWFVGQREMERKIVSEKLSQFGMLSWTTQKKKGKLMSRRT